MKNQYNLKKTWILLAVLIVIGVIVSVFDIHIDLPTCFPNDSSNPSIDLTESIDTTDSSIIPNGELTFTMIDVGQADSFLFVENDKVALIDCGTRSTGNDVVSYLNELGISKIDILVGTHPHDDHMGGMYDVITNFEIGTLLLPDVKPGDQTSNWYIKLMQEIKNQNLQVTHPQVGEVYTLSDTTFKILGPLEPPTGNLNNYSIVIKATYGDIDILMTGDAEKDVEASLVAAGMDLDAEILKVGHHGSDTSTSTKFLDAVSPSYALISSKVGNKYNHPSKETMENLESRKIKVFRTDESGTITFTITADNIFTQNTPDDYLDGPELSGGN